MLNFHLIELNIKKIVIFYIFLIITNLNTLNFYTELRKVGILNLIFWIYTY